MTELNPQQKAAVLHKEGPLLILAGAGSGKTRVIVHRIAELIRSGVPPERILAVTFTNKAAGEMRERVRAIIGGNLALSPYDTPKTEPFVGTFHALSLHIIKTFHKDAGLPRHFTIYDREDSKKATREAIIAVGFDPKELEPGRVLSIMSKRKGNAETANDLRENAASYVDEAVADVWEKYSTILREAKALDFDDILVTAHRLLAENPGARSFFKNAWDFIHVDEYQDTNRIQYELVRALLKEVPNITVVGDGDQCLIKGTKITMADGSQKSIENIAKGDAVLSNFGSGDMRGALVSRARAREHRGDLITIVTKNGRKLQSTPEHIHFAGYRLGIAPQYFFTYLMHKQGSGWRLGVSQVYTKGQRKPMIGFQQRCNQEHADALWLVGVYTTMQEARVHEYQYSLKYQIPTLPFVARKGLSTNGYVHDQETLRRIFASLDTEKGARKLLIARGLHPAYPHHRAQATNSTRRNITITLCGDRRGSKTLHRISMVGSDAEGKAALTTAGFSVRSAKMGSKSWRFETAHADYGALLAIIERLRKIFPSLVVIENARLGGKKEKPKDANSLRFMPAASVLPGMALFDGKGGYDTVASVERAPATPTPVYDLDVAGTHNFIANGIATHNCIYSWRGASHEHIMRFEQDFPGATVIPLVENYRSTKTIIQAANDAIAKNTNRKDKELMTRNEDGEPIAVAGFPDENEEAAYVAREARRLIRGGARPEAIAVLYRANFQSRVLEEAFLRAGIDYQVLGTRFFERKEVKDALSYLRAALNPDATSDFARAIQSPSRGIGKVTLAKAVAKQEETLPASARAKVEEFRGILRRIATSIGSKKASEAVRDALTMSGLWSQFEKGKAEDAERLENLKELVTVASKYDTMPAPEGIERLIEEAALQSDQDELAVRENKSAKSGVKLMTVHAAKGLEFDAVFVTGLEDGLFPHERDGSDREDTEEERRLFYVALTRAKKKAYLTYAVTRRIFGTRSINTPSEFVVELDPSLIEIAYTFDREENIID